MDQYRDTAVFLKEHKQVIVNVFAITMFQQFALFTAMVLYIRHLGLEVQKAVAVITLQAVIAVSVDMLPLPGGMGISEKIICHDFLFRYSENGFFAGNDPEPWDWILYRAGAERLALRS